MYVVVSKWEFDPGQFDSVESSARQMHAELKSWPEVRQMFNVRVAPNQMLAVIEYTDQASYERLILDENGPFVQAAKKYGMENHARWLWSERGERVDY